MKFTKLAAAMTLALAFSAAQAATPIDNSFKVKIKITGTCIAGTYTGNATSDVDFGTEAASTTTAKTATNNAGTKLAVLCSKNLPLDIAMTPTGAALNSSGAGTMKSITPLTNTATIAYQLLQPTSSTVFTPAYTKNWGNESGVNTFGFVGAGLDAATQTIRIPVQASIAAPAMNVEADDYIDTVVATLTY